MGKNYSETIVPSVIEIFCTYDRSTA